MTEKILSTISGQFAVTELPCGEFQKIKVSGMTFRIRRFYAQGLGPVSLMTAGGFLGLMKMDTVIINPFEKDAPLFSYDRIHAMGRDSLYLELYNTMLEDTDLSALDRVTQKYSRLPGFDPGTHWYDPIKLPQSLFKRGRRKDSAAFSAAALEHLDTFLQICRTAPNCDGPLKKQKAAEYSEGLLTHGGPAVDVFLKHLGKEKTQILFRTVLFSTEN